MLILSKSIYGVESWERRVFFPFLLYLGTVPLGYVLAHVVLDWQDLSLKKKLIGAFLVLLEIVSSKELIIDTALSMNAWYREKPLRVMWPVAIQYLIPVVFYVLIRLGFVQ